MRKFLLFIILCLGFTNLKAQLFCPNGYGKYSENLKKYHVTAGYGVTALYGDVTTSEQFGNAGLVKFDYQIIKGLLVGLEGQFGTLKNIGDNSDRRYVNNKYKAGGIMLSAHIFDLLLEDRKYTFKSFGENLLDGIYVGVGILGVSNKYSSIFRDDNDYITYGPIEHDDNGNVIYDNNGRILFKEKINSITLPTFNTGIAVPLISSYKNNNFFSIVLNAQFNLSNNDELDGYIPSDGSGRNISKKNDVYNLYSAGLRYSF